MSNQALSSSSQAPFLFETARQYALKKGLVISCPLVITTSCQITPLCKHCMWRTIKAAKGNNSELSLEEAVNRAIDLEEHGVNRVRIVAGWMGYSLPQKFSDIVHGVRKNTDLEIFASFGAINRASIEALKKAGADGIVSGIETANPKVFKDVRPGDNFAARIKTLKIAKKFGLKTSSAIVVGMGETDQDNQKAVALAGKLEVDSLRIIAFVPSPYTEMEKIDAPNPYRLSELVAKAAIDLEKTDVTGLFGGGAMFDFVWGIKSGANEFTVNRHVFRGIGSSATDDGSEWFKKLWYAYSGM